MIDLDKVTKTRGGDKVLMAKYFPDNTEDRKIIAVFQNKYGLFSQYYYSNGRFLSCGEHKIDLVENKQEITKWCNVYSSVFYGDIYTSSKLYDTKEQAFRCHDTFCSYIKAVPITVEI